MPFKNIRPSPIAGTWYPAHPATLRHLLDDFLAGDFDTPFPVSGLLVPHAGMRFSGAVAGKAFRHLRGRTFDTVVVIGPSHYPYPYPLLTTAHDAYETPLGQIRVAEDLLHALGQQIEMMPLHHDQEHSIEMELPFLQHLLGEFRLLPLAMMDQAYDRAVQLAAALAHLLEGQSVLYVASSDLSHFYEQAIAQRLDQTIMQAVAAYQPGDILRAEEHGRGFACGRGALATVMLALGNGQAHITGYATSGDVTGDFTRVVGYGSAIFK